MRSNSFRPLSEFVSVILENSPVPNPQQIFHTKAACQIGSKQCMRTAEYFGDQEGMEVFPGINKHHSEKFFRDHDLTWSYPRQCINRELMAYAEMGCFPSHYLLWKKCVELGEPIMILEDDAEFRAPVPALRFREFIHLGEPVLRRPGRKHVLYKLPLEFRDVYYPFRSSYGAWAYGISPEDATKLLRSAQEAAVRPADNFITPSKVHMLFYQPQPLETSTHFSAIRQAPWVSCTQLDLQHQFGVFSPLDWLSSLAHRHWFRIKYSSTSCLSG